MTSSEEKRLVEALEAISRKLSSVSDSIENIVDSLMRIEQCIRDVSQMDL